MNLYFFISKKKGCFIHTYLLTCNGSLVSVLAPQLYGKLNDGKNHSFYYIESYIASTKCPFFSRNLLNIDLMFISLQHIQMWMVLWSSVWWRLSCHPILQCFWSNTPSCYVSCLFFFLLQRSTWKQFLVVTLNSELMIIQWFLNSTLKAIKVYVNTNSFLWEYRFCMEDISIFSYFCASSL